MEVFEEFFIVFQELSQFMALQFYRLILAILSLILQHLEVY